jgi:hypothetical protein
MRTRCLDISLLFFSKKCNTVSTYQYQYLVMYVVDIVAITSTYIKQKYDVDIKSAEMLSPILNGTSVAVNDYVIKCFRPMCPPKEMSRRSVSWTKRPLYEASLARLLPLTTRH